MRGIGGIFFDDLADGTPEELFRFVRDCSNAFLPSYFPIVQRRRRQPFSEEEKKWQQIRRGHYVEFNVRPLPLFGASRADLARSRRS